jgi:3-hydroxyacyl-[acyl-carrier-protein] dehydratase
MIGQLGLCLYYFLENERTDVASDAQPIQVRATRTIGAYYLESVPPGAEVILIAKRLDYDGLFARVMGQTVIGGKIGCVAAVEGYLPS